MGLALSVSLTAAVFSATSNMEDERLAGTMQFISGGVALLTLVINGVTAGHVLKWLKLAKPVMARKRAIRLFEVQATERLLKAYNDLVSQPRFRQVSFAAIKAHVPLIKNHFSVIGVEPVGTPTIHSATEFDDAFSKDGDDDDRVEIFMDRLASFSNLSDSHS